MIRLDLVVRVWRKILVATTTDASTFERLRAALNSADSRWMTTTSNNSLMRAASREMFMQDPAPTLGHE